MRFRLLLVVVASVLLTSAEPLLAADACIDEKNLAITDGKCWRTLAPLEKTSIVRGIWVGQRVQATALRMSDESSGVWFGADWSSIPDGTSIGDIVGYFDKLYETPANRNIQWHYAYLLAALMARDDDENDRLSLLTFLRSNEELPTAGKIVGIKSPNVLEIQTETKTLDVRLDGVTVPAEVAPRALAFLNGLKLASYGKCDDPKPTPVSLYFGRELFDNEGRLSADVRIGSFVKICVNGSPVDLNRDGYRFTNIGVFLISHGLAERDPRVDPKWSDQRKGFSDVDLSKDAKEAKLYLYGENTDPLIETVSGQLPPDTY